ncbi:MAG: sulfite exporter TauE/SafE family protein [Solirubrobacteraceae bacterium]
MHADAGPSAAGRDRHGGGRPDAAVGATRQRRYGNLRTREGIVLGVLASGGALAGVALANVVPERALEISFAMLQLFVAAQLGRRALQPDREDEG